MTRHALRLGSARLGSARLGMAGGGEGTFIGAVHRMAAALDGDWQLSAGAFSTDADRNGRTGASLGLDPQRVYASVEAMLAAERALPEDARIDAVAIVTPNHLHAPMAISVAEAETIARTVDASDRRLARVTLQSLVRFVDAGGKIRS